MGKVGEAELEIPRFDFGVCLAWDRCTDHISSTSCLLYLGKYSLSKPTIINLQEYLCRSQ